MLDRKFSRLNRVWPVVGVSVRVAAGAIQMWPPLLKHFAPAIATDRSAVKSCALARVAHTLPLQRTELSPRALGRPLSACEAVSSIS